VQDLITAAQAGKGPLAPGMKRPPPGSTAEKEWTARRQVGEAGGSLRAQPMEHTGRWSVVYPNGMCQSCINMCFTMCLQGASTLVAVAALSGFMPLARK
jgi:hypothetical protein